MPPAKKAKKVNFQQEPKERRRNQWKKTGHSRKKEVLERYVRQNQEKPLMPAHSVDHQMRTSQTAGWYLRSIGRKDLANTGEIGAIGHDLVKMGAGHGPKSAEIMGNALKDRVPQKRLSRITKAMANHGKPMVKNGKRLRSDPVSDAVFFADSMERMGFYGIFRIGANNGEFPHIRKEIDQKAKKATREKGIPYKEARDEEVIKAMLKECKYVCVLGDQVGVYEKGKPVDTIPPEKYFPKAVTGVYRDYINQLKNFTRALEARKPWATDIALSFFKYGAQGKKEVGQLILDYKPRTHEGRQIRESAIKYMFGNIAEAGKTRVRV